MDLMNRLSNCHNPYQGNYKKVLCVCSAGLLRSPSVALVLSQEPFNFNTRAAGINGNFALIVVDQVLLEWADEIVCMNKGQQWTVKQMLDDFKMEVKKPFVKVLDIPDSFEYRDLDLLNIIKTKCLELFGDKNEKIF
jgi:predicted protein tyrosine phosphatase